MISAVCWVPKGIAKVIAEEAEPPSKEEIEEFLKSNALEDSEGSEDEKDEDMKVEPVKSVEVSHALAAAMAIGKNPEGIVSLKRFEDITDGLRELDMDHYDDEDDEEIDLFSKSGDLYYASNDMDPYLLDKNDEDDEEEEDRRILPSDGVIVCACNEDDVNLLKIYVLEDDVEDGTPNLFVHHEIFLSAFPLCTAWLDCNLKGGEKGNFIAIGSMEPGIEIWDLDLVEEVQPFTTLGGFSQCPSAKSSKDKKKNRKKKESSASFKEDSHTDSVLDLAWNKEFRNLLASASADKSVKVWDVAAGKCGHTLLQHSDKVQSIAWNFRQSTVLLSGSFDRTVVMMDMRTPSHAGIRWSVPADVESVAWDPHTEHSFVVSMEDGTVQGFDIRAAATNPDSGLRPSFTLHAHDKAVCAVSYNPSVTNLIATGSTDKTVKLWNVSNSQPSCVGTWKSDVGAVFSVAFSQDSPSLLAIGGSKGKLKVWDTSSNTNIGKAK